ncbi:5'-methylthioadenosine/adenosylhomocysteine nucleosidase [Candidatus Riesia pediculischaeffi]|uniref:adenosylhomocysteine nucleosidase n=1 Tax=Candidatus Riesia pediculischaeffi TaxID=428411 RepID=A0A1V0HKL1_9ENTR|nr:5'-methylthioadenosine/adenosylhomocysteine nucleosidase [Candidatus Riesia pediculischaeffi]ARC53370.1 hypothetical protein AOQ87_01725 [Candidatus Riesia pediculischaeffi]
MNTPRIAVVCAMQEEISCLKRYVQKKLLFLSDRIQFFYGKIKKSSFLLLKSGIGKVSSSVGTTILINKFSPDAIINFGMIGGLKNRSKIGDIIISSKNCYYDFDLSCFGYKYGQVPGFPRFFYSEEKLIQKAEISARNLKLSYLVGTTCSGDRFIYGRKNLKSFCDLFPNVIGIDMEGTAISQVCHLFKVPFIIVRSVSDIVEASNTREEVHRKKKNLMDTVDQLNTMIINLLEVILS